MADGIQINDQMCAKIRNKAGDNRNLAFKKKGSEREPKRFTPCSTSLMALGFGRIDFFDRLSSRC